MEDNFSIELPASVSDRNLEALQAELKQMDGIADAGSLGPRSIDPVALGLWVQAATGMLGLVSTAAPIVGKTIAAIRNKGIKGAKITLANGATISIDEISSQDLEKMLQAINQPASPNPG